MSTDCQTFLRGGAGYPSALEQLGAEAPEQLWLRGRLPSLRAVAVVGARAASAGALVVARGVASGLARSGVVVVSGGAIGVDAAAHRGAIDAGGSTVVVLGTGIDVAYPSRHQELFAEAVASGGALISQFPVGTQPQPWTFPVRNAVIAALSETTFVVEAERGSGSLYTAAAAARLGRRVIVLRGSAGCDALAEGGAQAAGSADEVLAILERAVAQDLSTLAVPSPLSSLPLFRRARAASKTKAPRPEPRREPPADPRARLIYEALDGQPRDLGEVAKKAGVPASEAMALAIDLELGGLATRAAGGRYLRHG